MGIDTLLTKFFIGFLHDLLHLLPNLVLIILISSSMLKNR